MNTKNLMICLGVAALILLGVVVSKSSMENEDMKKPATVSVHDPVAVSPAYSTTPVTSTTTAAVKEFSMTSYFEMTDGKPSTHFSLKDINVKQGDRVRIKVTNTKGVHNFVIDELGIKQETPPSKEVVIDFTADKVGDFVYYCSLPNHRAMGQWGTLHVMK